MNVALLEFPDEVEGLNPQGLHIVGLWPNVRVALQRRGIPCSDTLPYFDNSSHARILLKSEEWLRAIESPVHLEDESGIRETYNSTLAFHLRFYINYFLWAVEVLEGITRRHDVTSFRVCSGDSQSAATAGPSLSSQDRYLAAITRFFARERGISVAAVSDRRRSGGLNIGGGQRPPLQFLNSVLNRLSLARLRPGNTILVNAISYNMDRLIRELKPEFPSARWIFMDTSPLPATIALSFLVKHDPADHFLSLESLERRSNGASSGRLAQGLREIPSLLSGFQYRGVSFAEIFAPKIERDLLPYIQKLAAMSKTIRYVLEKTRPSLVLGCQAAEADALLGEWTQRLGIPSVSISHGTHTPPASQPDEIEKYRLGTTLILTSFGHTALQTPWAEKYISYFKNKRHPIPLKTGNLILAKLNPAACRDARRQLLGEQAAGKKVIVYATTLKTRANLRFEIHETLDEHLAGIAQLARAMNELENAILVVKLHPAAALKEDEVRMLIPETRSDRVRVMCRVPFEKVLSAADLLVSYSSTCIEEAIQNGIPVMLYDPWNRYQHLPAARYGHSAPAYYVNESKTLLDALRWILNHHDPREISQEVWREHIFPPETRDEFVRFIGDCLAANYADYANGVSRK